MRGCRDGLGRLMMLSAALLAVSGAPGAAETVTAIREGDLLKLAGGKVAFSVKAADGTVSVLVGERTLTGKGALVKLSPGEGGKAQATDLAKAKGTVEVGDSDVIAARVPLHPRLPLTAVALWDVGGGASLLPVALEALGMPADAVLAGYDLAEDEFFGPVIGSLARRVGGGQFSVVAVARAGDAPALLCTSGSLAGKGDDLAKVSWDAKGSVLSGTSSVAKDARYELRLLAPPEPVRWVADAATVAAADAKAGVRTMVMQTGPWLRVYLQSPEARAVSWQVKFSRKPPREVVAGAVRFTAQAVSPRCVALSCYGAPGKVVIRRNDGAELVTGNGTIDDSAVAASTAYTYSVHPLSWAGRKPSVAEAKVKTPDLPPLPPLPTVFLGDLKPVKATNGWNGEPRKDTSIEDKPIRIRGEVFKRGIGVHAISELVYEVRPNYKRFVAAVGVDDEKNDTPSASVTFEVYADDKVLYKSKVLTPRDERVSIDVAIPKGAKVVRLVVGDGGNGIGCDHADWANAGFITEGKGAP